MADITFEYAQDFESHEQKWKQNKIDMNMIIICFSKKYHGWYSIGRRLLSSS